METLLRDLRFGLRGCARRPGFTATAILTLALGIGATTTIFSIVNATLLVPLPYEAPERLALVWARAPQTGYAQMPMSGPELVDLRREVDTFSELAAFSLRDVTLTGHTLSGHSEPVELRALAVSPQLLALLGAAPRLGRDFRPDEARPGAAPVALLAHEFWQQRFNADPEIVGRSLTLDRRTVTVAGILPPGLPFPPPLTFAGRTFEGGDRPALWLPLATPRDGGDRGRRDHLTLARLAPGVDLETAQTRLATAVAGLAAAYPEHCPPDLSAYLDPLHGQAVRAARPGLLLLFAAAGLVLLVTCANVASLLLARAAARAKEMAVRSALGAEPRRLVFQLLAESLLLAGGGGGLGLLLSLWATQLIAGLGFEGLPRLAAIRIDGTVLVFSVALSAATALLFGLMPAVYAARRQLAAPLKAAGGGGRVAQGRLQRGVVIFEVALAVMLLATAGLLSRSLLHLQQLDLGFDPRGVTTATLTLPAVTYRTPSAVQGTTSEILDALRALPAVQAAGASSGLPLDGQEDAVNVTVEATAATAGLLTQRQLISPGFLQATGTALRAGRLFMAEQDVMVNEAFAKRHWPGLDPLGRRLTLDDPRRAEARWRRVVGVVADTRDHRLERRSRPTLYLPLGEVATRRLVFVVRAAEDAVAEQMREAVWSVDPALAVEVRPMQSIVTQALAARRLHTWLIILFAAAALLLGAIGIYGVMSFLVAQRRHEVAIRMACGARQRQVTALVLGQGARLGLVGIACGLVGTLMAGRIAASLLYGVRSSDPLILGAAAALLFAVCLAAALLPARRAAAVDPVVALRAE